MRLREYSESIPKPMVNVGARPILWHVMKYYAHYGHKDFILCLGWKAQAIKQYFLNYDECVSNDFVLTSGGKIELLGSDIDDWNITLADTGTNSNIAQRLMAVREHVRDEDRFFANYTDGLTDLHLPDLVQRFESENAIAAFLSVKPEHYTFHAVDTNPSGKVTGMQPIDQSGIWINGGYFMFDQSIFDYIEEGDELVDQPFTRLIAEGRLATLRHDGFFGCMDTFKEKEILDDLVASGPAPWEAWKK